MQSHKHLHKVPYYLGLLKAVSVSHKIIYLIMCKTHGPEAAEIYRSLQAICSKLVKVICLSLDSLLGRGDKQAGETRKRNCV